MQKCSSTMSKKYDSFSVSLPNTFLVERKYFQTSVIWEVVSFSERVKQTGDTIISPLFQCSGASWHLTLYPFGENEISDSGYADLCVHKVSLNNASSERNFAAYFKIIITTHNNDTLFKNVSDKCVFQSGVGSHKFQFSKHHFNEAYFFNVTDLTISLDICVEDDTFPAAPLKGPTKASKDEKKNLSCLGCASSSLSTDFEKLYDNPHNSDVTLKLGEVEFRVHKLVLSARSPVFAAMFEHEMQENCLASVDLLQMEVGTVQDMLRHIYCGKVRELSPEEALNLYVAADRYDLAELKAFCRQRMLNDLAIDNVCDIAAVADLHNDESMINVIKPILAKHAKEVIKTEQWKAIAASKTVLCAKMFEWAFSE